MFSDKKNPHPGLINPHRGSYGLSKAQPSHVLSFISFKVYTVPPLPASKQLCALAHLRSICKVGFIVINNLILFIYSKEMPLVKQMDGYDIKPQFYGGIMPACEGLSSDWSYTKLYQKDFCLDTSNNEEYHLLNKKTKVN